jgi:hypothetical protein
MDFIRTGEDYRSNYFDVEECLGTTAPSPSEELVRFRQKHEGSAGRPAFAQATALDKAHVPNADDLGAEITEMCQGDQRPIDRVLHIDSPRRERPADHRKTRFDLEIEKRSKSGMAGLRDYVLEMMRDYGETPETLARHAEHVDPATAEQFRQIGRELAAEGITSVYA